MKKGNRDGGFTLIELLIVIIIIGILAAIAIPMFLGQRTKAKEAALRGAVHNIELGIGSYAVDNSDVYPLAVPTRASLTDPSGIPYVDVWPENPWTEVDMKDSTDTGDYTYTVSVDRLTFSLAGHMATGPDFVVP